MNAPAREDGVNVHGFFLQGCGWNITKEMTEAETEEKLAQEEYEAMMRDSTKKRMEDTQAIEDKTAAKAGMQEDLVNAEADLKDKTSEFMATEKYLGNLHLECDWLLKNFDLRKEARAGEIDALQQAKAVLSGADYSLAQTSSKALRLRR